MDAASFTRRAAFAVIVCALAALGAWMLGSPARHGGAGRRAPAAVASPRPAPRRSAEVPATSPAVVAPTVPATPPAPVAAATPGQPGIYSWLPFSPAGLNAAAATAVRFARAYATYSAAETGPAYAASLQPLAEADLVAELEAAYEAPGVAADRRAGGQSATATAVISAIRALGPGSLTFVVQLTQRLSGADGGGTQDAVTSYAVTVSGSALTWLVSNIELAAAGNS